MAKVTDFLTGADLASGTGAFLSYQRGQGILLHCACGQVALIADLPLDETVAHGECPACNQTYAVVVTGGCWPTIPIGLRSQT